MKADGTLLVACWQDSRPKNISKIYSYAPGATAGELLIDNVWTASAETMAVNAWDGSLITPVSVAGEAEVDAAVTSARKAFATWRVSAPLERTALLNRFADLIEIHELWRLQERTVFGRAGRVHVTRRLGSSMTRSVISQHESSK